MNLYDVLIKPVSSEKSNALRESEIKRYAFFVHKKATKTDVKNAVTKLFDVKVTGVRTLVTTGKVKRKGLYVGKTGSTKRAIVTLAKDQVIKMFEE